jgi:phosphoribosylaminoimidazole-succinocarboxamide synthase
LGWIKNKPELAVVVKAEMLQGEIVNLSTKTENQEETVKESNFLKSKEKCYSLKEQNTVRYKKVR